MPDFSMLCTLISMKSPWIIVILAAILYGAICWIQYANLRNGIDLGTYTQILYNISSFHAFPPFNSILGESAWGDHAHFIMIVLAPLFALYPHDITPIILQILAIATSGWALCDIAYRRFKNIFFAYAILIAYLLFFGIQYALSFDIHANVFTCAFLAWLFWAYETDKKKTYWILFALTLLTREDAALFTGAFGFYVAAVSLFPAPYGRNRGLGIMTLCFSIAYFLVTTYSIMPALQENHTALAYFDIDKRIFFHPVKLFENMFDDSVKVRTFTNSFGSFSYLPLFSPFSYLATAPNFIARFLSGEQQRWGMKLHYSASLASILAYGSILGTATIMRIARRIPVLATKEGYILIIASIALLYSTYVVSLRDVDLPIHQFFTQTNTAITPDALSMRSRIEKIQQQIPEQDSIATISSFVPIFATRETANYIDSTTNFSADWIIVSNQFTSWPLSRKEINTAIHNLKQNQNYVLQDDTNNLFVFKKS